MPPEPFAPLARVGLSDPGGGLRLAVRGRCLFSRAWGGVRTYGFQSEPQELPEGYLVNHAVMLNLGGDSVWETNVEGEGWERHPMRHHGIGVIPAGLPYAAREPARTDYVVVEMAPDFVSGALARGARPLELRPVWAGQDPFVAHVLLALAEQARSGAGGSAVGAQSLATALLAHLAAVPDVSKKAPALPSAKLRRVLAYVSEHLDAQLGLQHLADVAEMDFFRFVRAFKQATGSSPHRYIVQARIDRAKELLLDDDLTITEIALQTGFATPSHFSVTFRRHTDLTPRAFREEAARRSRRK